VYVERLHNSDRYGVAGANGWSKVYLLDVGVFFGRSGWVPGDRRELVMAWCCVTLDGLGWRSLYGQHKAWDVEQVNAYGLLVGGVGIGMGRAIDLKET